MAARALLLLLLLGLTSFCSAKVHEVGDEQGWTIMGNVNYTGWASKKKFHVGDVITFVYNKDYHNVMLVTKKDYKSCNASKPIAVYKSGNDSIDITRAGHYFFICGVPGHCAIGQKVDIRVAKHKHASSPHSAPVPVPVPVPDSPASSSSSSTGTGTGTGTSGATGTGSAPVPKLSSGARFVPADLGFGVAAVATIASLVV